MTSVRKRKFMLRTLHTYFQNMGYLPTEQEYNSSVGAPYRRETIKKYLGGWVRMVNYLQFYYPQWREEEIEVVEKEAPKIDLSALEDEDE